MVETSKGELSSPSSPATRSSRDWFSRAQRTSVGSVLVSWDFGFGVAAGSAVGALFGAFAGVRGEAFTFFLTLGGIAAGVAALVLAPMAMMLSMLSPEFIDLLNRTRSGVSGLMRPFRIVVVIAALASLTSIVVSLLGAANLPSVPPWMYFAAAAVPAGLLAWAVAGCVQLISLSAHMIQEDRKFRELSGRRLRATKDAGGPPSNATRGRSA